MPNDIPDWTGQNLVQLVSAGGQFIGDLGGATLNKDSATETITTPAAVGASGMALASFKAAVGLVPALVGVAGPILAGSNTHVAPLFNQATTAGNFLVACCIGQPGAPVVTGAGWALVIKADQPGICVAIYSKPNCGAAEAPPVFDVAGGTTIMIAQLAEFSGVLAAAPTDQVIGVVGNAVTTITATNPAKDVAFGDLVILATRWSLGNPAAATFSDVLNNGAAVVLLGTLAAPSGPTRVVNYGFAVIPAVAAALPLGVRAWDYDASGVSAPAAGTAASVILAAGTGKAYRVAMLAASVEATTAAIAGSYVQVLDGAAVLFQYILFTQALIGQIAQLGPAPVAYKGSAGNSLTFKFTAAQVGALETVSVGAYLQ